MPLPDNGLIADDVFFIPRISEIPSILVENAFPILPEQEEWVLSDKGKQILADTLYQGILSFYQKEYSQQHRIAQIGRSGCTYRQHLRIGCHHRQTRQPNLDRHQKRVDA